MPSSRFLPLLLALLGLVATRAYAQSELPTIHLTDYLNGLYDGDVFSEDVAADKFASNPAANYEVGDSRTFSVYNHLESGRSNRLVLDDLVFTLMADHERFLIWVETDELESGHVRETDVAALRRALADETPEGSIDRTAGIVVNNERIFGTPPNVDGDGKTDVLLVDIRDGWTPGSKSGYVAGFVWKGDLTRDNRRDVVYVDVNPGLYRNGSHISTTAIENAVAHEYQHLIHFHYDLNERTFVNEGLSEWASIINGYPARAVSYLGDATEHNVSLLDWRRGSAVLNDYQRAGLFTSYLAQRLGTEATGSLVQAKRGTSTLSGIAGYHEIAAQSGLDFSELVADFHLANFFNDPGMAPAFAHELDERRNMRAEPTYSFDGTGTFSMKDFPFNAGSVQYFVWSDVGNLLLNLDVSSVNGLASMRDRLRITVVGETADGAVRLEAFGVGGPPLVFDEGYERISAILVHHSPDEKGVRLDLSAEWTSASSVDAEAEELPAAVALEQNYPNPFNPRTLIRYQLTNASRVRLSVFDALGRRMAVLVDEARPAGSHEASVDAASWPSGTYVYVLETGSERLQKLMTIVR